MADRTNSSISPRRRPNRSRSRSPPRRRRDSDDDYTRDSSTSKLHKSRPKHSSKRSRSRSPPRQSRNADRSRERDRNQQTSPRQRDHPSSSRVSDGHSEEEKVDDTNKEKPNFGLSGKLAAEENTYNGVVLKYSEPPESRKPKEKWRLHVFKGKEQIDILHIHQQSAYLLGRDRLVADIPTDHPSCSKQHAVIQFRKISERNDKGELKQKVKPYIIDLESTNGTFINSVRVQPARYIELKVGDVLRFGESTRDYVILHEELSD